MRIILVVAGLALVSATSSAVDLPSPCGAWQVVAPIPTNSVLGAAAASTGTSAYLAGGYYISDLNQFRRYDPAGNTWTTLAPMPDATTGASAVYSPINNKVYVFGGELLATGLVKNANRIYDLVLNSWSTGASMPSLRRFMASAYYNGKIYLVGGYSTSDQTSTQAQVWEYDPLANTWNTSRLNMPHPIGGAGFGIINGHLYVAGGGDGSTSAYSGVFDYEIATNIWTQRADLLQGVSAPGSAVVEGHLWLFGGSYGGSFFSQAYFGTSQHLIPPPMLGRLDLC